MLIISRTDYRAAQPGGWPEFRRAVRIKLVTDHAEESVSLLELYDYLPGVAYSGALSGY